MPKTTQDFAAIEMVRRLTQKTLQDSSVENQPAHRQAEAVARELAPVLVNATNNEPWYQSRVTLGSMGSVLAAISQIMIMLGSGDFDPASFSASVTVLVGAGLALYGRYKAKKPLGQ